MSNRKIAALRFLTLIFAIPLVNPATYADFITEHAAYYFNGKVITGQNGVRLDEHSYSNAGNGRQWGAIRGAIGSETQSFMAFGAESYSDTSGIFVPDSRVGMEFAWKDTLFVDNGTQDPLTLRFPISGGIGANSTGGPGSWSFVEALVGFFLVQGINHWELLGDPFCYSQY